MKRRRESRPRRTSLVNSLITCSSMSVPSLADRAACLVDHSARHDIWNLARGGDLDLSGSGTDGPPYFLESRTENRRTAGVWPLIIGLSTRVLARTAAL